MQSSCYIRLLLALGGLWQMSGAAEEQLDQESILIRGNQGLPGTIYIAPWKRVSSPLENVRLEGEFEEEAVPLERDLFQRELELQREGYSTDNPARSGQPAAAPVGSRSPH
jgi:hypothetical protein